MHVELCSVLCTEMDRWTYFNYGTSHLYLLDTGALGLAWLGAGTLLLLLRRRGLIASPDFYLELELSVI